MKRLFGKLMVYIAIKLRMPIFVVYYMIITIWIAIGLGKDFVPAMFGNPVGLIVFSMLYVLFPIAWSVTTNGKFWSVPTKETMKELFGE